jgi:hypothetical protein
MLKILSIWRKRIEEKKILAPGDGQEYELGPELAPEEGRDQ